MGLNVTVDSSFNEKKADVALLSMEFSTDVKREKNPDIWQEISNREAELRRLFSTTQYNEEFALKETAKVCQDFGMKVSRYPFSSWALIKRLMRGKDLYQINNVVDAANLVSLQTLLPVGSYDADKIEGDIRFRLGEDGEQMETFGKGEIDMKGVPLFSDEKGGFGSVINDSPRTMIQESSKRIIMVVISLIGQEYLTKHKDSVTSTVNKFLSDDVEVSLNTFSE